MQISAHEDCGLGDVPMVTFALQSICDCRELYKAKNDGWRLPASNAILALCRAVKSREADHFQAAIRLLNSTDPLEIPDYCYDKHTKKSKTMGRGIEHFRTDAAKLNNALVEKDAYKDKAYEYWTNPDGQKELGLDDKKE